MKKFFSVAVLCLFPLVTAAGQSCSKRSPSHTVALLELYTSEGCSSCPPADRFVSAMSTTPGLGTDRVVPLSLHVDYWDSIGWKDRFAQHVFTERQHWLSTLSKNRVVYTPEIFVAGRELRDWSSTMSAVVKRVNEIPAQADIGITLGKVANSSLPVEVSIQATQRGSLFVALYENGLKSKVNAGENRGVTLRHDAVVRAWIGPVEVKKGGVVLNRTLIIPPDASSKHLGVAAFVQSDSGDVLQALALPVCGD